MQTLADLFWKTTRRIILALALLSGLAILAMIVVTLSDVLLRFFHKGILGAYDIVRVASVIAITCSLPYVTAVKGHIAIEFLYQRFNRIGRTVLDSIFRLLSLFLFGLLAVRSWLYGLLLLRSRQVMPTLSIPVFWIPWLTALCFVFVSFSIFYHLTHPGKEFIKS